MATVMPAEKGESPGKYRVLVVEDEILIRLSLADELRRAGFFVVEASNADEALSVLKATYDFDLLLTDVRMPGKIDGLALARWVRRNVPDTKVALASANVDAAADGEFDAVFSKPVWIPDVVARLRQLLPAAKQTGPEGA
ncbi:response regulator [Hyphomicrobium sp.]|jgi:CheY-like chemotaxis protein|uniref:response regulator n=1 Tax=Hyphomicrobium sp. TaxID=82 RepID=UPI002BA7FAB8|nr:response regulator [Hyphomicrobium sp.]HVZ04550.1 response regulator [Hyphomicrobium sp.]